jgi:hypothetical protein
MVGRGGVSPDRKLEQSSGVKVVQQIISSIVQFLQQGIAAIFRFLELIWTWSFGQIIAVFQSDWKALPVWKIVLLIAVMAVIAYVLYKAVTVLWEAAVAVFGAFVALLSAFVSVLPYIVAAGLIAFAGGWVIHNVNF